MLHTDSLQENHISLVECYVSFPGHSQMVFLYENSHGSELNWTK